MTFFFFSARFAPVIVFVGCLWPFMDDCFFSDYYSVQLNANIINSLRRQWDVAINTVNWKIGDFGVTLRKIRFL